jgi:hypothetical protein
MLVHSGRMLTAGAALSLMTGASRSSTCAIGTIPRNIS